MASQLAKVPCFNVNFGSPDPRPPGFPSIGAAGGGRASATTTLPLQRPQCGGGPWEALAAAAARMAARAPMRRAVAAAGLNEAAGA